VPPWAVGLPRPIEAASTEIVADDDTHLEVEAFDYDRYRIEGRRYDACVEAGACPPRSAGDDAGLAVGMSWQDAQRFCETRGMRVQSPPEDVLIQQLTDEEPMPRIRDADPEVVVVFGFRCTRRARRLCGDPVEPCDADALTGLDGRPFSGFVDFVAPGGTEPFRIPLTVRFARDGCAPVAALEMPERPPQPATRVDVRDGTLLLELPLAIGLTSYMRRDASFVLEGPLPAPGQPWTGSYRHGDATGPFTLHPGELEEVLRALP
jgi:hypothetical protein